MSADEFTETFQQRPWQGDPGREQDGDGKEEVVVPESVRRRASLMDRLLSFRGFMEQEDSPAEDMLGPLLARGHRLLVAADTGHGKALALDTPIPTTDGWKAMGDLDLGDLVFDETGHPTMVVGLSPVWHDRPAFRVTTRSGEVIVADAAHEWELPDGSIMETHELATRCHRTGRRVRIRAHGALEPAGGLQYDLPVDPYLLGAWLGDGSSAEGLLHLTSEESQGYIGGMVQARCPELRFVVRDDGRILGVRGLKVKLRALGVLGDKHVPARYLRASRAQRMWLLRGLIDTDGHVAPDGQVEFTSIRERLAQDVAELVRSLGVKATICEGDATIDGRFISRKYRVMFYLEGCATIPRKLDCTRNAEKYMDHYIWVEPAEPTATRCIQVAAESHLFLAGRDMIPTRNTTFCMWAIRSLTLGTPFLKGPGFPGILPGWMTRDEDGDPVAIADPYKVLVIDCEQSQRTVKKRLDEAGLAEVDGSWYWRLAEGVDLSRDGVDRQVVKEVLNSVKPDVVLIDPLFKLHRGNPNDSELAAQVMSAVDFWRDDLRFGLVIPVHVRKQPSMNGKPTRDLGLSDVHGAATWTWGAEVIIGLERRREKREGFADLVDRTYLRWFKDREGDLFETTWELRFQRDTGYHRGHPSKPGRPVTKNTRELVRQFLEERSYGDGNEEKWWSAKEIMEAIDRKSVGPVNDALKELAEAGGLERTNPDYWLLLQRVMPAGPRTTRAEFRYGGDSGQKVLRVQEDARLQRLRDLGMDGDDADDEDLGGI